MCANVRLAFSEISWLRAAWRQYWHYRLRVERALHEARRYQKANEQQRGTLKREWLFDLSREVTPLLGVAAAEGLLLVQTDDIDLGRGTFIEGPWDQEIVAFAVREAQAHSGHSIANRTVLEIGANIGTTTLLLLKRYDAGRVIAFEPVPRTADLLRAMTALNRLGDRVDVREVALTNKPGILLMELSPRSPGDNRVRTASPENSLQGEADRQLTEVRGSTLDREIDDLDSVGLVWMDAQGHEGHVLAGARKLLETDVPVVTEFWPYGLSRAQGLETFLALVEQHYSRILDTGHGDTDRAEMHPATAIRSLVASYPGPGDFTDLILLKR